MKELIEILNSLEELAASQDPMYLCTIVETKGSSYRRPGAKMLVRNFKNEIGIISGGCLENDILYRLKETDSVPPFILEHDSTSEEEILFGTETGCGGLVRILVEPFREILPRFEVLHNLFVDRKDAMVATLIYEKSSTKNEWLIISENTIAEDCILNKSVKEELTTKAFELYKEKKSGYLTLGDPDQAQNVSVFFEYLPSPLHLYIFGAGNDAVPVADFARKMGWIVTVSDYRKNLLNGERFKAAHKLIHNNTGSLHNHVIEHKRSLVLLMTHNFSADLQLISQLLPLELGYLGMLGSRKRCSKIHRVLVQEDPKIAELFKERLYFPTGLDISPDTPEEIAISILSEMLAVLNGRPGGHLRDSQRSVHVSQ